MSWLIWIAAIVVGFGVLCLGLGVVVGRFMANSPRTTRPHYDDRDDFRTPADLGLEAEEIAFGSDGLTLKGWLIEGAAGKPALIGVHGGRDDKRYFLPLAPALHAAGYTVLLFDGRSHGDSEDDPKGLSLGIRDHRDVIAAADFLEARGHDTIGALGCSQGGASVVLAAAKDPRLKALWLESTGYDISSPVRFMAPWMPGFAAWLMTIGTMVTLGYEWRDVWSNHGPQFRLAATVQDRPVFICHGGRDEIVPMGDFEAYRKQFGPEVQSWVLERGKHCILRRGLTDYAPKAVGFFDGAL